jgi:hypothetical protein
MSLVKQLSFLQVIAILTAMGIFSISLSTLIAKRIAESTQNDLKQQVGLLVGMMSTNNAALADNARALRQPTVANRLTMLITSGRGITLCLSASAAFISRFTLHPKAMNCNAINGGASL